MAAIALLASQSRATPLRILLPPSLCVTDTLSSRSRAVPARKAISPVSATECSYERYSTRYLAALRCGRSEFVLKDARTRRAVVPSSCAQDARLTALAYQHRRSVCRHAAKRRGNTHQQCHQTTRAAHGPLRRLASIWASCGCGCLKPGTVCWCRYWRWTAHRLPGYGPARSA